MSKGFEGKLLIITPVYNDWKSFSKLLSKISSQYEKTDSDISILAINDASEDRREIDCNYYVFFDFLILKS